MARSAEKASCSLAGTTAGGKEERKLKIDKMTMRHRTTTAGNFDGEDINEKMAWHKIPRKCHLRYQIANSDKTGSRPDTGYAR